MAEFNPANSQQVIKYWKGMLGNPAEHNAPDTVYFKCNVQGGAVTRNLGTILRGKRIFVPVNPVSVTEREAPNQSIAQLKAHAKDDEDSATHASITIDGEEVDIRDQKYRISTDEFDTTSSGKAVADGYYLIINPLPVGRHKITFRGGVKKGFSEHATWEQDVTCEFEVR